MRKLFFFLQVTCFFQISIQAQDGLIAYSSSSAKIEKDSSLPASQIIPAAQGSGFTIDIAFKRPLNAVLGYSKNNRPVEVYYFPGTSNKKAMVIGGMHGSELSSVEMAHRIIKELSKGGMPYYNVIVIPCLFPDNALTAAQAGSARIENNTGRYTHDHAVDPNRQMPQLGKAFNGSHPVDANNRVIEKENQLLLQLIQTYLPDRIVNLHAIKDVTKAGIYADPRTDCNGTAKGFEEDSSLAIKMAQFVLKNGGYAGGNFDNGKPSALYFKDPEIAAAGHYQKRNLEGSSLPDGRGHGASLGSWASTAVCDEQLNYSRPPMRLITVEFPGYKKPSEYKTVAEKKKYSLQIDIFTAAIVNYFLGEFYVEDREENPLVSK